MKKGTTNPELAKLIVELKKTAILEEAPIWKRIAVDLEKPSRQKRIVNLSRIDMYSKENDIVVVPGKVLGSGEIGKKVTVAAFNFSGSAEEKLKGQKCDTLDIYNLMKKFPKGQNVRIIG